MKTKMLGCISTMVVMLLSLSMSAQELMDAARPLYITGITPFAGDNFAVSMKGAKKVVIYDGQFKKTLRSYYLGAPVTGVAVNDNYIYATTFDNAVGKVAIINNQTQQVENLIETGSGAVAPLVSKDKTKLYVCNQFQGTVSEIDLTQRKVVRTVHVLREPNVVVEYPEKNILLVTNFLPAQRADVDVVASCVSVIDLKTFTKIKDIRLANGSNALHGMAISPDGQYAIVSHNLGRFQVPTSQIQQGWMNTSAVSIINMNTLQFEGAVLVDDPDKGAAGTWDVKFINDKIVVGHSGTHEVSIIDYKKFVDKFRATPDKEALNYDLRFLYGMRERIKLYGNGPREFTVRDGKAYIPTYFSDTLNILNVSDPSDLTYVALNPNRVETTVDKGEKYFNDAMLCFQNWQSCNGCHPGDARMDGMNWDLMNDGMGNPKSCKSMLYSHVTPPSMISGIRPSAEYAVKAGYNFIQFVVVSDEVVTCTDDYLKSLRHVQSPFLVNGQLSEKAKLGQKVFEALDCDKCHLGPYYTDMKLYKIGPMEPGRDGWDTPTLIEVWRTAPYLFDGRAATLEDVFVKEKHGINKKVSKAEMDQLVEYVKSL